MALTTTLLASARTGAEGGNDAGFTISSVTPGASCVLALVMTSYGSTTTLADTGHTVVSSGSGPTWTKRSFTNTSSDHHYAGVVWTAEIGGSDPGTFNITVDWAGAGGSRYNYGLFRVTGTLNTSPIGGSGTRGGPPGARAIDLTLDRQPQTNDVTVAISGADTDSAGGATFGAGTWTEVADGTGSGLQLAYNIGYRTGSTSATVPWAEVNAGGGGDYTSGQAAVVIRDASSLDYPYLAAAGVLQAESSTTALGPVVIPSTATTDDIMLLCLMCSQASTFSTPTDWTVLGTAVNSANQSTAWFWKRHDGSETNPSSTTSATMSGTIGGYGRIYVFRGCKTTGDPFEDVTMNGTPTQSTTPASAAIDTTDAARLAVSIVLIDGNVTWLSGNPPSGWDICGSRLSSTTGGDATFDAISALVPTATSVSAVTIGTISSNYWRTLTLALIPPSTAGSPQTWTGNAAVVDVVADSGAFLTGYVPVFGTTATSVATDPAGTTTAISKPSATVSGVLLILIVDVFHPAATDASGMTVATFTKVGTDAVVSGANSHTKGLFWRVADGGEGSTFTITHVSNPDWVAATCRWVSDIDTAAPINVSAFVDSTGATTAAPEVTTTVNNCLVVTNKVGKNVSSFTTPSGYTGAAWTYDTGFGNVWSKNHATAGATGTPTSGHAADAVTSLTLAIAPFIAPQTWVGNSAVVDVVATSGAFTGISPQTWTGNAAVVDVVGTSGSFTGVSVLASLRTDAADEGYTTSAAGVSATAMTIACWVKWPAHRDQYAFFLGFDLGFEYWLLGTTDTNLLYFASGSDGVPSTPSFEPVENTWYHVAFTWSSTGTDTLYVAAEADVDHTTFTGVINNPPQTSWKFEIGTDDVGEWSNVEICAVKIWTATLSDAEIATEREYYRPIRTANLWAGYDFSDGPSTTDNSGNGRTLALREDPMTTGGAGPDILLDATGPQTWTGNAAVVDVVATSGSFVSTAPQTWGGAAALVYVVATSGSFARGQRWPTTRSGRKILDQLGEPWMIRGQAVWSLGTVSQADQFQVIDELALHGHNCIMVTITETYYNPNPGDNTLNFYGESPFTGGHFASPLNPAYWNRWLATVDYAATKGITMMMVIAYAGYAADGAWPFIEAATTTQCQQYGNDIATLHLSRPNVQYMIGGDKDFTSSSALGVRYNAMMLGLRAADPNCLIFAHSISDKTALQQFGTGYSTALDANHIYTFDGGGIDDAATAWTELGNTLPLYFIEGAYWHGESVSDQHFRSQLWMGCSWGFGCFDGHVQLWSMGSDASAGIDWELNLVSPEMNFTKICYEFYADPTIRWGETLPDFGTTFLTTGIGVGTNRAAVCRGTTFAIVYFPNSRTIVCNLTSFSGATVNARWFDPTDATYSAIGTYSTALTSQAFTHPGNTSNDAGESDWVLVLEGTAPLAVTPEDVDHLQDVEDGAATPTGGGTVPVWGTTATSVAVDASGTTTTISKPSATTSGALLMIIVDVFHPAATDASGMTVATFTKVGTEAVVSGANSHTKGLFWRIADGSEGSTFTITHVNNPVWVSATCRWASGGHPTAPINAFDFTNTTTATTVVPEVTTTVANCLVVTNKVGKNVGSFSTPSGYTGSTWTYDTGFGNVWSKSQASAGLTGAPTSSHAADAVTSLTYAIAPTPAEAGTVLPDEVDHLQDVDDGVITQTHLLVPADVDHLQDVETTTATPTGVVSITPDEVVQLAFSETTTLLQTHRLFPVDAIQVQVVDDGRAHDPTAVKFNMQVTVLAPMLVPGEGTPAEEGPGAPVFAHARVPGAPMLAARSAEAVLFHGSPGQPVI